MLALVNGLPSIAPSSRPAVEISYAIGNTWLAKNFTDSFNIAALCRPVQGVATSLVSGINIAPEVKQVLGAVELSGGGHIY